MLAFLSSFAALPPPPPPPRSVFDLEVFLFLTLCASRASHRHPASNWLGR